MRILVSFVSTGVGDKIVSEIFIRKLRFQFPNAEIIGLDDQKNVPLEEFRLPLNDIFKVEPRRVLAYCEEDSPEEQEVFLKEGKRYLENVICREKIDLHFYFLGDPWYKKVLPLENYRERIRILDGWRYLEYWRSKGEYPLFPVQPEDLEYAQRILSFPTSKPLIAIHLRNTEYRRKNNLDPNRYKTLIQQLSGVNIVILGNKRESPCLNRSNIIDLTQINNKFSISQLASILSCSNLFVGGESGLTHLAAACKRPVVVCNYCLPHGPLIANYKRRIFWYRDHDPLIKVFLAIEYYLENSVFPPQGNISLKKTSQWAEVGCYR